MKTISQAVEEIIARRPFLAEGLHDGIINFSSLARLILPDIEKTLRKDIKAGAVTMAIKRYSGKINLKSYHKLVKVVRNISDIIVRSNLSDLTFRNSGTILENHRKLLTSFKGRQDIFYTFVQGVFESNLILNTSLEKDVDRFFKNEKPVSKNENLSAITIKLPEENVNVPGLYYYILQKIAWEGINIIELVSSTNEFTLIVKYKDVDRAFVLLKNLR